MLKTKNFNLNKPELNDTVDISKLNENADIIDTKMKEIETKAENIKVPVQSINNKTGIVDLKSTDIKCTDGTTVEAKLNTKADTFNISDSVKNSSSTNVASSYAVRVSYDKANRAYDLANTKQDFTVISEKFPHEPPNTYPLGFSGFYTSDESWIRSCGLSLDHIYAVVETCHVRKGYGITQRVTWFYGNNTIKQIFERASFAASSWGKWDEITLQSVNKELIDKKQDKPTNSNTSYGQNSLGKDIVGDKHNVGIGYTTLYFCENGQYNTAVGDTSMFNNNGNFNTAVGADSLFANETGKFNTAVGYDAGYYKQDGTNSTDLYNITCLGSESKCSGNNQVQLGNQNTTTYSYGPVQNRSDRRDKTDIQETPLGLDFIKSLKPVQFRWDYREFYNVIKLNEDGSKSVMKLPKDGSKKRKRLHQGFIAQDVKEIMDKKNIDFGGYQDHKISGGCDVLSLGYEEFIAPLVKAVQEQQKIIENLQQEIFNIKNNL